nr:pre-mRNA splicing Prp18-interacting factor [Tanacetum cinerariifolium]
FSNRFRIKVSLRRVVPRNYDPKGERFLIASCFPTPPLASYVICVGCGTPLYGFSPCQWCTCERCGNDLRDGFCSLCNSKNSCVYDPNSNSFDCPPDSYHPPHPTYETYSGDSCGNDSQFGYDCPTQLPLNYEPEPNYIQNINSYPHDSSSFPQQYLCENCEGLHETFQCQPMNQNFYNSNSLGFDQTQPPQFLVIHQPHQDTSIKMLHDQENTINSVQTFLRKFNRYSFFETLKNRPAFYDDDDDDEVDYTIAIIPVLSTDEPNNSLSIGDEHLDTIPATESDEVLKSSVENLIPILTLNDNPIPSSDCKTKSPSTSLNSLLEETNTSDNSLPEFETFCFDVEEISSEISSGSPTNHSDSSLYASFLFDLLINPFHPVDRSDFYEFTNELIPFISLPEYDCFLFKVEPN